MSSLRHSRLDPLTYRSHQEPRHEVPISAILENKQDDIPFSDAETLMETRKALDGKDVVAVLETVIVTMQLIPEAVGRPTSHIVPPLKLPILRERDGKAVFGMSADARASLTPN